MMDGMTEPRDRARPIPQRPGGSSLNPKDRPDLDGDVYVVDTRPRPGRRPGSRAATTPKSPVNSAQRASTELDRTHRQQQAEDRSDAPPGRTTGSWSGPTRASRPRPQMSPHHAGPQRQPTRSRKRRWAILLVGILVAWVAFEAWVPIHAWNSVTRVNATPPVDRPAAGIGSNYILVGSDSRVGMSEAEQNVLSTGPDEDGGQRTDSIILVHRSENGPSSMVSIPRDSYVQIPGHGRNKINAAFSLGGPQLLVATIESATGLRIDGFLEIGFGGFANVVDSLGGVEVCVPFDMVDERAGINLKAGCQNLDGPNALGYVRARYSDPRGDIGRAERQRQFLSAIIKKAATPSTVLIPWRYYGFAMASASGLRVGEDTSLLESAAVLQTMRDISNGNGLSMVVPIENPGLNTPVGQAVKWDRERALALFEALKQDDSLTAPMSGTDGAPTGQ